MSNVSFPEWLNENSLRSYPLAENVSKQSQDGEVKIPNNLIVDANLNVSSGYSEGNFFVSRVELLPDRVGIELSYWDGSEASLITAVTAIQGEHKRNQSYFFQGAGENQSIRGSIAVGKIEDVVAEIVVFVFFAPKEVRT